MRYLETRAVPIADLAAYPGNARVHDDAALDESAQVNGQYRSVVARVVDGGYELLAGHGTVAAFGRRGDSDVRVEVIEADDTEARRIVLADNATSRNAGYEDQKLLDLLDAASKDGGLSGTGWDADAYKDLLDEAASENPFDQDPRDRDRSELDQFDDEPPVDPISRLGDVWALGPHRLMCGDSTDKVAVATLLSGAGLAVIHADPPYGMGKEGDGVLNDNLYGAKLDAFQMSWWRVWKDMLADNGSAYIWGNAPDLWRLWWRGGLADEPDLVMRNEIVWDKGSAIGMRSDGVHSYPVATERCLFVMRGEQFLGNQNKDDYWEGYEPLRAWLSAEVDNAGWTKKDVNRITGKQMAGHWLSKSQFQPIPEADYRTLQAAAEGRAFTIEYAALFDQLFPQLRDGGNAHRRELAAQLRERRSFFDNTHDTMRDVWPFPRVVGEERQGHATPKPVAMVERVLRSSSCEGDAIGVPFGGSGPDVVAAHLTGRRAYVMELQPAYCDVIARRYQDLTGDKPVLERTGEPYDFTAEPPCVAA